MNNQGDSRSDSGVAFFARTSPFVPPGLSEIRVGTLTRVGTAFEDDMDKVVTLARDDQEIESCFEVMAELRPHLKREDFVSRVRRQKAESGYELAYLKVEKVKAVAGFRVSECLAWGKFLYVDDLVSGSDDRSKGYGGILFDWLVAYAREAGCDEFHLDSGVQRFAAHRFYLKRRMAIEAHHFGLKLKT